MTAANVKHLAERAELLRQTRSYFDRNGFLEVQPPCLTRDCVVDAYLDPIRVESEQCRVSDPRLPSAFYLHTSPESAMKRMLVAGAPSIYSLGPVFRSGETGQHHNVEFTMLEWYEVGGDLETAVRHSGQYVCELLSRPSFETITYREAFVEFAGLDPIDAEIGRLQEAVRNLDSDLASSVGADRNQLLDVLMSAVIVPYLGKDAPTVVTNYPIDQAALAKQSNSDPQCAARFEVFVDGIELANGYDELLDPDVLKDRAIRNNEIRQLHGRTALEVDTTLVKAMRLGLPQSSGVALGIDRLLMIKVGARVIGDVMPFTIFSA